MSVTVLRTRSTSPTLLERALSNWPVDAPTVVEFDDLDDGALAQLCISGDVLLLPDVDAVARQRDEVRTRAALSATVLAFAIAPEAPEVLVDVTAFTSGRPELPPSSAAAAAVADAFDRKGDCAWGFSVCSPSEVAAFLDRVSHLAAGRTTAVGHKANSVRATDGLVALDVARREGGRWQTVVIDHLAALLTESPDRFEVVAVAELYAPVVLGILSASREVTGAHRMYGEAGARLLIAGSSHIPSSAGTAERAVDVAAALR